MVGRAQRPVAERSYGDADGLSVGLANIRAHVPDVEGRGAGRVDRARAGAARRRRARGDRAQRPDGGGRPRPVPEPQRSSSARAATTSPTSRPTTRSSSRASRKEDTDSQRAAARVLDGRGHRRDRPARVWRAAGDRDDAGTNLSTDHCYGDLWDTVMSASSATNQVWTIACNAVGEHDVSGGAFWGGSGVWAPSGLCLVQASRTREELLVVHDLDLRGAREEELGDFDDEFDFKQVYRPLEDGKTYSREL